MNKRYWHAGDTPDVNEWLLDWVNENVVAAIKGCWEDDKPVAWADVKDGAMVLTVGGPGKPTDADPAGHSDIYTLDFDLMEELREYSNPYEDIGGPRGDEQRDDVRERASFLRKLADDVTALADRATESANASVVEGIDGEH